MGFESDMGRHRNPNCNVLRLVCFFRVLSSAWSHGVLFLGRMIHGRSYMSYH
jgi:hypothetical protein